MCEMSTDIESQNIFGSCLKTLYIFMYDYNDILGDVSRVVIVNDALSLEKELQPDSY